MLRPAGSNPYEEALIEKIRETIDTIAFEDDVAKHPERFASDSRAAAIRARAKFQAELKARSQAANLTFTAPTRKHT